MLAWAPGDGGESREERREDKVPHPHPRPHRAETRGQDPECLQVLMQALQGTLSILRLLRREVLLQYFGEK